MKNRNFEKGKFGESVSVNYLKEKGYKILEKNFRTRFGEIDIIVRDNERIIFVEVKTKTGHEFGEPWEMVNKRKLNQVKRMGKMYLIKKRLGKQLCRIDVVGVWLDENGEVDKIKHWENVY